MILKFKIILPLPYLDMISRSFAEKGDLTTLANVTYDAIAEQVKISWFFCEIC